MKRIQLQLVPLAINYALVIWMVFTLQDSYLGLFIFLLIFLSIERIGNILKISYMMYWKYGLKGIAYGILGSMLFTDLTMGLIIDEDEPIFESFQFSKEINYIVHQLNFFPLISCFFILADQSGKRFTHLIQLVLIICGVTHVGIVEVTIYLRKNSQNFNILIAFKRLIEGMSRFFCTCACLGELLFESLWFLLFISLFIPIEIKREKMTFNCYQLSVLYQINIFSSRSCLKSSRSNNEYYLIANAFQASFIFLIFIIRTFLNPTASNYDIILFCSFVVNLHFILSSWYYAVLFYLYGPFQQIIHMKVNQINGLPKANSEEYQQQIEKILLDTVSLIKRKSLCKNFKIFSHLELLNDNSLEKYLQFIADVLYIKKNNSNLINFQLFKQNLNENIAQIKTEDEFLIITLSSKGRCSLFSKISNQNLLKKDQKMQINCQSLSSLIQFYKDILNLPSFFAASYMRVTPKTSINPIEQILREILKFIAFQKLIQEYLPFHPSQCMFDLYEESLSN